jgi:hypothetical protein
VRQAVVNKLLGAYLLALLKDLAITRPEQQQVRCVLVLVRGSHSQHQQLHHRATQLLVPRTTQDAVPVLAKAAAVASMAQEAELYLQVTNAQVRAARRAPPGGLLDASDVPTYAPRP